MTSKKFDYTWEQAVQWLRNQPDQTELVKAAFYDDPLIKAAERYWQSTEWAAVRELLAGRQGKALEIGAGRGIASFALAKDGWNVTALEPDQSYLVGVGAIRSLCQESGVEMEIVDTWGEVLPFEDESFDLVFCRAVLHHARDLEALCKQVGRVLKAGGLFIATREHVISRHDDLDEFLHSHPLHDLYGGEHAYLLDEYIDAIKGAGLRIDKVINPAASDINLYPQTLQSMKKNFSKKLKLPFFLIPNFLLKLYGALSDNPGRLYSFLASK